MAAIDRTQYTALQSAATGDGNGLSLEVHGYNDVQQVEVRKTGAGTCTLTLEGSFDNTNFYTVGYGRVDGQATLTRAAAGIAVTTGTFTGVYQVFDAYRWLRARISGTAGGSISLTAMLYAEPG